MNERVYDENGNRQDVWRFYTIGEILCRINNELEHLPPLCGYRYTLKIDADNATEPPYLEVAIYDKDGNGVNDFIIYEIIDQNTYYDEYIAILERIVRFIRIIKFAYEKDMPYKTKYDKAKALYEEEERKRNESMPF